MATRSLATVVAHAAAEDQLWVSYADGGDGADGAGAAGLTTMSGPRRVRVCGVDTARTSWDLDNVFDPSDEVMASDFFLTGKAVRDGGGGGADASTAGGIVTEADEVLEA